MTTLVDVDLTPSWAVALREQGFESTHWTEVGPSGAPDAELLLGSPARRRPSHLRSLLRRHPGCVGAVTPSVMRLRMDDLLAETALPLVVKALGWYAADLAAGALVSIDAERARARVLPLR